MTRFSYLVDTHVLLWGFEFDRRLSTTHRDLLRRGEGLLVSMASIWEITIKSSLGKLKVRDDFLPIIEAGGISILPITLDHVLAVRDLPQHHGDPFDRMLVAQAQVERLTILTADRHIARYDVAVL